MFWLLEKENDTKNDDLKNRLSQPGARASSVFFRSRHKKPRIKSLCEPHVLLQPLLAIAAFCSTSSDPEMPVWSQNDENRCPHASLAHAAALPQAAKKWTATESPQFCRHQRIADHQLVAAKMTPLMKIWSLLLGLKVASGRFQNGCFATSSTCCRTEQQLGLPKISLRRCQIVEFQIASTFLSISLPSAFKRGNWISARESLTRRRKFGFDDWSLDVVLLG